MSVGVFIRVALFVLVKAHVRRCETGRGENDASHRGTSTSALAKPIDELDSRTHHYPA